MARRDQTIGIEEDQPRSTLKSMIIGIMLSIVVGGGSGFGLGYFTGPMNGAPTNDKAKSTKPSTDEADKPSGEPEKAKVDDAHSTAPLDREEGDHSPGTIPVVTVMDPIVTNLFDPGDTWIRLELALTSDQPLAQDISNQVHEDLLAYVRSMRLAEMAGPSAFVDLKAELLARARQRTENQVKNLYVKTLLYE